MPSATSQNRVDSLSPRPAPDVPDLASMTMSSASTRSAADHRQQQQQRRGRVAARTGDQPRPGDGVAVILGQAIDRLALERRRAVLVAVPFGVGVHVAQPEVGRHVDHLEPLGQRRDDLLGGAVRQAADDHVAVVPVRVLDLDQVGQRIAAEMREHALHRLAGVAVGGHQGDARARVRHQKAHQIRAGVAAGAEDADPNVVLLVSHHSPIHPPQGKPIHPSGPPS